MPVRNPSYCEGMLEARTELREYLKSILKGTEQEETLEVTLTEASKGAEGGRAVEEYTIGFDDGDLELKVKEIVSDAEADALRLQRGSGRVKYAVRIVGRRGSLVFGLEVTSNNGKDGDDEEDDDDLDDLEAPTKKGVFGQMARHTELSFKEMRAASKGTRELLKDLRVELNACRAENRELREANRSMLRLEQDLHNMDHARRLDWKKQEKAEERKDKFVGGIEKMLPVVGAHIMGVDPKMLMGMMSEKASDSRPQASAGAGAGAGAGAVPGPVDRSNRTEDEVDIDTLMASLTPTQAKALSEVFTQEQFMILGRLHARSTDRLERDQARAGQTNGATANGQTNGSGPAYGPATS